MAGKTHTPVATGIPEGTGPKRMNPKLKTIRTVAELRGAVATERATRCDGSDSSRRWAPCTAVTSRWSDGRARTPTSW